MSLYLFFSSLTLRSFSLPSFIFFFLYACIFFCIHFFIFYTFIFFLYFLLLSLPILVASIFLTSLYPSIFIYLFLSFLRLLTFLFPFFILVLLTLFVNNWRSVSWQGYVSYNKTQTKQTSAIEPRPIVNPTGGYNSLCRKGWRDVSGSAKAKESFKSSSGRTRKGNIPSQICQSIHGCLCKFHIVTTYSNYFHTPNYYKAC
jgi:hypothetical protein